MQGLLMLDSLYKSMKRSIVLRDYAESDLGVYQWIAKAMGIEPKIEIVNYDNPSEFEAKIRSLDGHGDLFLALVYQKQTEISREWLPSVDRFGLYIHRDNQWRTSMLTVQPVDEHKAPPVIQAPYVVRPWFCKCVENVHALAEPDIDVMWLGSESYKMLSEDSLTRGQWLDRFEAAVKGRFNFYRQLKLHSVEEYAALMNRSKIALHIHGLAEHCFRYFEALHLKRCLVPQKFNREKLWADPGDLMPWFNTPEEAADICADLIASGRWKKLGEQQYDWFKEAYSQDKLMAWGQEVVAKFFP
jgi:hypothetical protein